MSNAVGDLERRHVTIDVDGADHPARHVTPTAQQREQSLGGRTVAVSPVDLEVLGTGFAIAIASAFLA